MRGRRRAEGFRGRTEDDEAGAMPAAGSDHGRIEIDGRDKVGVVGRLLLRAPPSAREEAAAAGWSGCGLRRGRGARGAALARAGRNATAHGLLQPAKHVLGAIHPGRRCWGMRLARVSSWFTFFSMPTLELEDGFSSAPHKTSA